MSVTDYRASRRDDKRLEHELALGSQQQLLQAQLAVAQVEIQAKAAERQADRDDAKVKAEAALALKTLEATNQRNKDREAREAKEKADKIRKADRARARKERQQRRATFVRSVPGWVSEHLDLAAALAVMACSIVPALISQATTLNHMGLDLVMVVLLPVMLECSAWAATAAEAKALKANRAAWPYRIAAWLFALLAASINWQTGLSVGGRGNNVRAAMVLAASSIVPVALWQLIQIGRHREAKALQRAERKRLANERRDRRERGKKYPEVWDCAMRLRAIAGHDALTEQKAWLAAYAVFEGAGEDALPPELMVLLSAEMLGIRVQAEELLAVILADYHRARAERLKVTDAGALQTAPEASAPTGETDREPSVYVSADGAVNPPTRDAGEPVSGLLDRFGNPLYRTVSPQINPFVPPPAPTTAPAPARTPARTPRTRVEPAGRNLSEGAKKAAAQTAKTFDPDESRVLDQWVADQIRASKDGAVPSWKAVLAESMRLRTKANEQLPQRRRAKTVQPPSRTWVYERIAAGKKIAANGGLHVVRSA